MTPELESECRQLVLDYANALNDWEVRRTILERVEAGRDAAPAHAARVAGLTLADLLREHEHIFARYIVPRDRRHGTNPGSPTSYGKDGRFFDVRPATIASMQERDPDTIEVVTGWGYLLPIGQTMFVLKRKAGRWLIDSLKTGTGDGDWEAALI